MEWNKTKAVSDFSNTHLKIFPLLRNRISYNYSRTNYLYILLKDTDKRLLKIFCFTDKREVSRFYSLAKSGGVLVEC